MAAMLLLSPNPPITTSPSFHSTFMVLVGQPGTSARFKKEREEKGKGNIGWTRWQLWVWNEGQKSRSSPGVRKGFEGGQISLYKHIPKLRGIAGGIHTGLPKYIPVSLKDIEITGFREGDKILGEVEVNVKLSFKARTFSASAKEKLEAAGCYLTVLPGQKKWVKPSVAKNLARADEYFAKKRAAAAAAAVASE